MKKARKRIIIAVVSVIVIWLIIGIVDFALVHNYRKPLFCVGVDLADDGGSGRYIGLAYFFDIEGNFVTEGGHRGVTSFKGYLFGKEVNRGFWEEMIPTPYKNMQDVIEHAPSLQGNVTEVYETYMIIHFVTNGYPYGADCSVSLTPVHGDSYTDVSVGDEVVVYFDGNIMETAPLQLGTVYAITLRTPANRTDQDIHIENSAKITEPPKLLVVCGEEQVTALRGTYSWEYSNEDGTGTGIEADSAHPLECKEIMPDVGIIYETTSALHPRHAYLEFDIVPTDVEIRYWNEDDWNNTTAESRSLDVLALEIDAADGSYSTDYMVELLEGNYIYEVIAKWNSSEKYSGTAYYSFYTVMEDYQLVTVQE